MKLILPGIQILRTKAVKQARRLSSLISRRASVRCEEPSQAGHIADKKSDKPRLLSASFSFFFASNNAARPVCCFERFFLVGMGGGSSEDEVEAGVLLIGV